jgi:large repetitive protein
VKNVAPTPSIGSISNPRQEGTAITVDGSATDPAGTNDTLTYAWEVFIDGSTTAYTTGTGTSFTIHPFDNGSFRIVLTVSDEDGGSATAESTIAVANVAPVAVADGASTNEDTPGSFTEANLVSNDTDVGIFDVLTVGSLDTSAAIGTVTDNGGGNYTYDPRGHFDSVHRARRRRRRRYR